MATENKTTVQLPRGILLTNDDGPNPLAAPFLLPFTVELRKQLESHIAALSKPTPMPTMAVVVPARQQSWVGKGVSRSSNTVHAHCNWDPSLDADPTLRDLVDTSTTAAQSASTTSSTTTAAAVSSAQSAECTGGDSKEQSKLEALIDEEAKLSGVRRWAFVDASPASVCNVALHNLVQFPVDLVVSGPNFGRNAGKKRLGGVYSQQPAWRIWGVEERCFIGNKCSTCILSHYTNHHQPLVCHTISYLVSFLLLLLLLRVLPQFCLLISNAI
jgi:5'/3'-nucleotidase SurE